MRYADKELSFVFGKLTGRFSCQLLFGVFRRGNKPPVLPGVGKKTLAKEKVKKSFVLQRKKNGTEVLKGRREFSRKVSLSQNAMKYQRELVYQ